VYRLPAVLAVVLASLAAAASAAAAGPSFVSAGGAGVLARGGAWRYVAVPIGAGTAIERIRVSDGTVLGWADLDGSWGIPAPTFSPANNEGLTRDGRHLIVATFGAGPPTRFAVLGARSLRVQDRFELDGSFAYDALSPDGSTLYLIQYVNAQSLDRYVVRAYDLRSHRLLPGRIADKSQRGWVMQGVAVTRATSADGGRVYTLYTRPGGYPFVHALDTVHGVAHCIGLPWRGDQGPLMTMRLALADGGRTLVLNRGDGKPWLTVDTSSWAIAHPQPSAGQFPWRWLAVAGFVVVLGVAAAGVFRVFTVRSRRGSAAPTATAMK
jgi:hypothetical protein